MSSAVTKPRCPSCSAFFQLPRGTGAPCFCLSPQAASVFYRLYIRGYCVSVCSNTTRLSARSDYYLPAAAVHSTARNYTITWPHYARRHTGSECPRQITSTSCSTFADYLAPSPARMEWNLPNNLPTVLAGRRRLKRRNPKNLKRYNPARCAVLKGKRQKPQGAPFRIGTVAKLRKKMIPTNILQKKIKIFAKFFQTVFKPPFSIYNVYKPQACFIITTKIKSLQRKPRTKTLKSLQKWNDFKCRFSQK